MSRKVYHLTYEDFTNTSYEFAWSKTLLITTPGGDLVPTLNCDNPSIGLNSPGRITSGSNSVEVTGTSSCGDAGLDWIYTVYFQAADSSYVESQCDTTTMMGTSTTLYSLKVKLPATTPAVGWNCYPWRNKNDSIGYFGKITLTVAYGTSWLSTSQPFIYMAPPDTQKVPLSVGWNLNSFNVAPFYDTSTAVFGSASSGIVLVKNDSGNVYWPFYNIKNLGHVSAGTSKCTG